MNKRLGSLLLCLWALLGTATAATPTVRIWPMGDSITEGCCLTVGGAYRTVLYSLLTNAGYDVDDVGTLQDLVPPPTLPDIDHEGHDGFRIDEIDAGIDSWASVLDDPDVILLHIGTNDAGQDYDMANAPSRLQALVEHIEALHPYSKIIVASIIVSGATRTNSDGTVTETVIDHYNAAVPGVVSHEAGLGKQVYFTDMHSCCTPNDLSDPLGGLHPNATGYAKMATNWFGIITGLIGPSGTANPPAILRVTGQVDLRHVVVTFSKPVADTASSLGNFSLGSGVSILQAVLDSTLRVVTLTTSPQTPSTAYTLTVSGVQDRTPQHNVIAPGTTANFQSGPVAEAINYSLVYSLRLPNQANYSKNPVPYDTDNHAITGGFSRIAYYLQLQPEGGALQYLWVSMNAFTTDASKIGVPTIQSGAFFQQFLTNMNVRSSVAGVVAGDGLKGGNIEFWWGDYGKANTASVPGASSTLYDFGDSASPSDPVGYGSMQVHNWGAAQTLFAFNDWNDDTQIADMGIGNYSGTYPDWTFAANAAGYSTKILQVYVLPSGPPPPAVLTVASSNPNTGVAITVSPVDNNGSGNGSTTFARSYNSGTTVALTAPLTAAGNNFQKWQKDGVDYGGSSGSSVTMDANHTMTAVYAPVGPVVYTLSIASSNPTNGVSITVSPTDKNGAGNGTTAFARSYNGGTSVTVTAPAIANGNTFRQWQLDGVSYSSSLSAKVSMNANHTMTSVYSSATPLVNTLSLTSVNPASGVAITVSPPDKNGLGNGATPLARSYDGGLQWEAEQGDVVAPFYVTSSGGVTYVVEDVGTGPQNGGIDSFTLNVATAGTYRVASVVNTPDQDHNSVYPGFEFNLPLNDPTNVWDMPITGGVWQKAYASWRGNGSNTNAQFPNVTWQLSAGQHTLYLVGREAGSMMDKVSVERLTPVTLTAPATAGGKTFQKWQKDGADYSTTRTTSVTMDASHTLSAVYH